MNKNSLEIQRIKEFIGQIISTLEKNQNIVLELVERNYELGGRTININDLLERLSLKILGNSKMIQHQNEKITQLTSEINHLKSIIDSIRIDRR